MHLFSQKARARKSPIIRVRVEGNKSCFSTCHSCPIRLWNKWGTIDSLVNVICPDFFFSNMLFAGNISPRIPLVPQITATPTNLPAQSSRLSTMDLTSTYSNEEYILVSSSLPIPIFYPTPQILYASFTAATSDDYSSHDPYSTSYIAHKSPSTAKTIHPTGTLHFIPSTL